MSDTEDSSTVNIQLSERDGHVLVIEYNATPDGKSEKYRNHHFECIEITYKDESKNVQIENRDGKVRLTIKFGFNIRTDGDKLSVWTWRKKDILSIQKLFFELDFTIIKKAKKDEKDEKIPNVCEFRLEKEYNWKVWKNSMSDSAHAKTSRRRDKDKTSSPSTVGGRIKKKITGRSRSTKKKVTQKEDDT